MNDVLGKPIDRVDGNLKVRGRATYVAEFMPEGLVYAVTLQSNISKGSIKSIDTGDAAQLRGVIAVITYKNAMRLQPATGSNDPGSGKFGEKDLLPLQDNKIYYDGQHIAMVVAETFEIAEEAVQMIKVLYEEENPLIEIEQGLKDKYQPAKAFGRDTQFARGDVQAAIKQSPVTISEQYTTPVYHHNAMEPHATIAVWQGDELTMYDSTQSVLGSRAMTARLLGIPAEKIHLLSPFIGGGFGSKGFMWAHTVLAPMAAKHVGKPVKLVLNRTQMFTCNGRRSRTIQKINLGANKDGKLNAVIHDTTAETSFVDEFVETAGIATSVLYACPNLVASHNLVRLNKNTPCPTRAPGEAPGTFAIESAMDELSYALKIDPIQLRLINYAEVDPQKNLPWSLKNLKDCYKIGADAIGWANRKPAPRSMQEKGYLVGYGMATAIYPANRSAATVKLQLFADGHAILSCCTQDIGTGTYTIFAQVVADVLGLPVEKIEVKLGDTALPNGPNSGGSQTAASVTPAANAAAISLRDKLLQLSITDSNSPLYQQRKEKIKTANGHFFVSDDPSKLDSYVQILARNKMSSIDAEQVTNVSTREGPKKEVQRTEDPVAIVKQDEEVERKKYTFFSFGAQFAKVLVDPLLGVVHVDHCVAVMDVGKILNVKTARNQIMGGMIFGIGMALMEGSHYDPRSGRIVTKDLADYHVPVHADMPSFDIRFIDQPDPYISPIGARGIGEIGITGITAAIVNAVYHATGKRIRDLPITPDKLLYL